MRNNKKGFTLIELLVVIAIIGLLSSLAVVSLNNARTKAQDARVKSDLKQISTALELFYSEDGVYPTNGAANSCDTSVNAMAEADAVTPDPMCCGAGNDLTTATAQTLLNALPCHPTANYGYEGTVATYCISGALPSAGGFFTCSNGSCYENAANCGEI